MSEESERSTRSALRAEYLRRAVALARNGDLPLDGALDDVVAAAQRFERDPLQEAGMLYGTSVLVDLLMERLVAVTGRSRSDCLDQILHEEEEPGPITRTSP